MDRRQQLLSLTTRWNDAWNSRQASKLAAFFADGGTYYEPGLAEPVRGRDGIGPVAQMTWSDWPEASFEAVSVTVEPPRVALEWRSSATHKSGKTVNLEGVDILEWDGDRIRAARVYYDVHGREEALK